MCLALTVGIPVCEYLADNSITAPDLGQPAQNLAVGELLLGASLG